MRIQVQLTRHYAAALAASWALVLVAVPLRAPGLALVGVLLGLVVLFGAHEPGRPRLRAEAKLGTPTTVEEMPMDVEVVIENAGRRAVFGEWRIDLPGPSSVDSGQSAGYQFLARRQRHTVAMKLRFHLFGLQRVGPVHLRLEDPFGFTVLEGAFGAPHPVRVYPRRDPVRDTVFRAKQKRTVQGAYEVSQPGTGFDFFGLRGYVHGDRPRDINWKASARTGSIIVNQHQKETDAEIVLLVDVRAATGVGRRTASPFAQACRGALAIAEAHLMARDAVRFVAYGDGVKEDRHTGATRHLQGVLDLAIDLEPNGALELGDVVRHLLPSLRTRSPVMIFSPLVGDASVPGAVAELLSRDHPVQALVPVPDWGDVPEDARLAWDAAQQIALAKLRRTGIPAATHAHGAVLEQSLLNLEAAQ